MVALNGGEVVAESFLNDLFVKLKMSLVYP